MDSTKMFSLLQVNVPMYVKFQDVIKDLLSIQVYINTM